MKAKFTEATVSAPNECDLQIVIELEDENERMLAKKFIQFNKPPHKFHLHGFSVISGVSGWTSINFGFIKEPEKPELYRACGTCKDTYPQCPSLIKCATITCEKWSPKETNNTAYDNLIAADIKKSKIIRAQSTTISEQRQRITELKSQKEAPLGKLISGTKRYMGRLFVCYESGVYEFKQGVGAKYHLEKVEIGKP